MAASRTSETPAVPQQVADVPLTPDEGRVWRRRHVLDLDDFSADEIEGVMETTAAMKEILTRDVSTLR